MGTVIDGRQIDPRLLEVIDQLGTEQGKIALGVVAPPDTRLIGDNDQPIAEFGEITEGIHDARQKFKVTPARYVATINVDNTIPIEEYSGGTHWG